MADVITIQELVAARLDAISLEQIINGAEWVEVETRLGRKVFSIATINALISELSNDVGVAINELQDAIDIAAAAGAGANGWTASLVVDGDKTQSQLNNIFKTSRIIDTRLYGLVVDTPTDQTAAIHLAFSTNPDCSNFYIPKGKVKANIVFDRRGLTLIGDGYETTIIEPYDLTKSAVNCNGKLYPQFRNISITAPQQFTNRRVVDARETRYLLCENVDIRMTKNEIEQHSYAAILLDQSSPTIGWTGYNKFKNTRFSYGEFGYYSDPQHLNSILQMDGVVAQFCGRFGIKAGEVINGTFINMDVAANGQLAPAGNIDEAEFGGAWIHGSNTVFLAAWHEYNASVMENQYSSNNVYFTPESFNCHQGFMRDTRSSNGVRLMPKSQAENLNISTPDRASDDGLGKARNQQLAKNGLFKYLNASSKPLAWHLNDYGVWTAETTDLPKGFESGIKFVSNATGIGGLFQYLYNPSDLNNSYIKDISKWVGRSVTCSFWLKNVGTDDLAVRAGFDTNAVGTGVYFSQGRFVQGTKPGHWQKFVVELKITGAEPRIAFGARTLGVNEGFILAGFSVNDGVRVTDAAAHPLTEDGGTIYRNLEVKGVISQNGDPLPNRPFQTGTNGLQTATTPINTTDKYIGKFAWNTTDSKLYYATGATATSAWKSIDGVTTITPV